MKDMLSIYRPDTGYTLPLPIIARTSHLALVQGWHEGMIAPVYYYVHVPSARMVGKHHDSRHMINKFGRVAELCDWSTLDASDVCAFQTVCVDVCSVLALD